MGLGSEAASGQRQAAQRIMLPASYSGIPGTAWLPLRVALFDSAVCHVERRYSTGVWGPSTNSMFSREFARTTRVFLNPIGKQSIKRPTRSDTESPNKSIGQVRCWVPAELATALQAKAQKLHPSQFILPLLPNRVRRVRPATARPKCVARAGLVGAWPGKTYPDLLRRHLTLCDGRAWRALLDFRSVRNVKLLHHSQFGGLPGSQVTTILTKWPAQWPVIPPSSARTG
ncbi:hypothetical protein MAPG_07554 [Magnaporthiopsis poae ATCC 64411]|uniref:Uncharacterized protein n=1 Tax=Magnaporthiopsis poae (strain ATCC 64411 / 73-15) TaxID=644358 RepID=A0A0C4E4Z7_MAGP6|nr:hypothetical protein MAPG_07554 [Magnaporthiopsis poae ATCC 64411]